jgi:uncharacterized membrane protein YgdD (TMEM256/DUF423 family)
MKNTHLLVIAAISLLVAVGLGAFGAHAWAELLESRGLTDTWDTASKYHFYHSLGLLWVFTRHEKTGHKPVLIVFWLLLAGMCIFSGSLYVLCLSNIRWLGAITPLGGLSLIAGWGILAWYAYTQRRLV